MSDQETTITVSDVKTRITAVLPFQSGMFGTRDLTYKSIVQVSNVGFDILHSPVDFYGYGLFGGNVAGQSHAEVQLNFHIRNEQFSFLLWFKMEDPNEPSTLLESI